MFWEEITKLVTEISWVVILLLVVGFILCFIEAITPTYGILGIFGALCEVAGIIVHAVLSGPILQVFVIVLIVLLLLSLLVLLFIRSAKYGFLGKSALVENKTALPVDYDDKDSNINVSLIGQIGEVVVECRPVGKMQFGNEIYDVLSKNEFLLVGEKAEVVDVVGDNIYVEKVVKGVLK